MTTEEFSNEIRILKAKIPEIEKKYQSFGENFKERLVNSVGQSMRYAEITELLKVMHKMLSMYNSVADGIFEEFINSQEAEMGDTENVNIRLKRFTSAYGYEMSLINSRVYLLTEEKIQLEEKLNYRKVPFNLIEPETDPVSPDNQE